MQDLLTLTLESLAISVTLVMFLDFFCGLRHLYYACATTFQDKPEEAIPKVLPRQIAVEPTPTDPKETAPLDDPARAEVEEVIESFYCHALAPKRIYLLPPALSVVEQSEIDYSGWTIKSAEERSPKPQAIEVFQPDESSINYHAHCSLNSFHAQLGGIVSK